MTWDKNALKLEVEGYADETKVNWSELARRYQILNKKGQIAKNGGQIAQEWLISQGVNLHRFKRSAGDERQPRRKKLKGLGGEISIPTPETNDNLKTKLKLQIQQGEFTVGELIVPREVSMKSLDAMNESIVLPGSFIQNEINKQYININTVTVHAPLPSREIHVRS